MSIYLKTFIAGLTATTVMTLFMYLAPHVYFPKMDVAGLLGALFGGNLVAGWIMHFIIGILFAFVYLRFANNKLPVENVMARGIIYGILVFIMSEIIFTAINIGGYLKWDEKESMARMIFGNALACMIYGAILGMVANLLHQPGYEQQITDERHAADHAH